MEVPASRSIQFIDFLNHSGKMRARTGTDKSTRPATVGAVFVRALRDAPNRARSQIRSVNHFKLQERDLLLF